LTCLREEEVEQKDRHYQQSAMVAGNMIEPMCVGPGLLMGHGLRRRFLEGFTLLRRRVVRFLLSPDAAHADAASSHIDV